MVQLRFEAGVDAELLLTLARYPLFEPASESVEGLVGCPARVVVAVTQVCRPDHHFYQAGLAWFVVSREASQFFERKREGEEEGFE